MPKASLWTPNIIFIHIFLTGFKTDLSNKQTQDMVDLMVPGFSGANMETLRKLLQQKRKKQFVSSSHFKQVVVGGKMMFEACNADEDGAKTLQHGSEILFSDLAPAIVTKQELTEAIKEVNKAVQVDAVQAEAIMKRKLDKNWKN